MTMSARDICLRWLTLGAALLLWAPISSACTVCFGDAEGPVLAGLSASMWVLIGSVYGLMVLMAVVIRRLVRRRRQEIST